MGDQEIRFGLGLVGPTGAGKSTAFRAFYEQTPPERRGPHIQIADARGRTLLHDQAELRLVDVGGLPLYLDLYALPGPSHAVLPRRVILSGCEGFVFVADAREFSLPEVRASFEELRGYLAERDRTPESAALVALLTHLDQKRTGSSAVASFLGQFLPADRIIRGRDGPQRAAADAVTRACALVLSGERQALEARRKGAPPPRLRMPGDLRDDVKLAHELYLRVAPAVGAEFSPHGAAFFGTVLAELGAASQQHVEEGLQLTGEARNLKLEVTLEEILLKRRMVDLDLLPRAKRVRACVEVIHEEVLFGRLANQVGQVSFERVKRALSMQVKRHFQHSLDYLLNRAGHLDRAGRRAVFEHLAAIHQCELERDALALRHAAGGSGSKELAVVRTGKLPLFGEVAVSLGLVTEEQAREAKREQDRLRRRGTRRFIGEILFRRGYLSNDEIPLVCKALEEKIADDRISGYRIERSLGRGNMALVFAARQLNLDRTVALKILDPKLLFDSDFTERFLEEARVAAQLNHPNIVQAYDVGTSDDLHYFAMEYVAGITVKDLIEDQGAVDEATAIDLILQTARALVHASEMGLVHRDVKPGNIMIKRDGVAKLCDLGLALRVDQSTSEDSMILGSPYYIAPEQIEGRADIDSRADIYSLGATLFHMITGRPPFLGSSPEDVCLKHLSDPIPDPSELSSTVTQRITPIVFKMMAKDRRFRYANAAEVVREFEELRPNAANSERRAALAREIRRRYPTQRWNIPR